jgi:hypothetical protein
MAQRLGEGARVHRNLSQEQALDRLRTDFSKLMDLVEALWFNDSEGNLLSLVQFG